MVYAKLRGRIAGTDYPGLCASRFSTRPIPVPLIFLAVSVTIPIAIETDRRRIAASEDATDCRIDIRIIIAWMTIFGHVSSKSVDTLPPVAPFSHYP
jgi:hypothetical protein